MTAYLIVYGKDPGDRFAAYSYPTRNEAREASLRLTPNATPAEHGNGGGCAYVIERAEDITLSGVVLVAVYNALTNANLKKFETRQVGVERLLKHLPEFARASDGANVTSTKEKTNVTNEIETQEAPKSGKRGRKGRFDDGATITLVADKNPKRPGSKAAEYWEKYKNGMTVKQAVEAGISRSDIGWNAEKGFLRVGEAA